MRYISEFRDRTLAERLARRIAQEALPRRTYRFMEFCGGHTHAIFRYGVQTLMPPNVGFVHGPGCPVCVLPAGRLDDAMELADRHGVILCTYGDMMRVPAGGRRSLIKAKAGGADIRMVYSTLDALRIARETPDREVVFFAIGFETTTPPTAVAILQAAAEGLGNFSVFCNHVLTPPAIEHILAAPDMAQNMVPDMTPHPTPDGRDRIDGFLGPSHVSTVIGTEPYEGTCRRYEKPVVVAGFEPLDVMQSVLMLIRQINQGRAEVENQYARVVTRQGNGKAQALMERVFELRETFEWRGLGQVADSARRIRPEFADFDAERRFALSAKTSHEVKSCECPSVLRGVKKPTECRLFAKVCTPDNPMGACMVSSEGACAAYYSYGNARIAAASGAV